MLVNDKCNMEEYALLQEQIKRLNSEYYEIRKSHEYKLGMVIYDTLCCIKKFDIRSLWRKYKRWINGFKAKKLVTNKYEREYLTEEVQHYFINERVAVYTAIFGKYDELLEPYCKPDNIDYFLVTDLDIDLSNSAWKRVDISMYEKDIESLSNIEKNRYFKMMPAKIFPDYKYSIYIDGNIQIIADLTPFIYKLNDVGITAHRHTSRDCVYDEMIAVLQAKKEKKENVLIHKKHLLGNGFPTHYGLVECNVLVREHTKRGNMIMEKWWDEFQQYSKRDQLSLPYVLFCEGIDIKSVTTLGDNVYKNPSLRIKIHS